jgi:hypothetical protein
MTRPVKLSILVPVYNEAKTVQRTIKRVLDVSFPCQVEVVMVDDASTDGTAEIIDQLHDERLIKLRHPANRGKTAAILTAAAAATGDFMVPRRGGHALVVGEHLHRRRFEDRQDVDGDVDRRQHAEDHDHEGQDGDGVRILKGCFDDPHANVPGAQGSEVSIAFWLLTTDCATSTQSKCRAAPRPVGK